MQLCSNDLMEDKACTNRPMTNIGFWNLFSDSDWSSDKRHRRSTSSGLHMLCGNLAYSSSCTQRVISLSSCEAELHGMVSTLFDGIFIRRCVEFVIKGDVEHILLTDSSSARQLCSRQGAGKVKHLSAKTLWIQDQVRNGEIAVGQISTAFNVADIGTKVLSAKRLKTLLRDIGIFDDYGANPIQAEERRGGDGRNLNQQMMQAARTIARLALLMAHEPIPLVQWVLLSVNVQLMFQLALVHPKFMMMITQVWSTCFCLCGAQQ